MLTKSYRETDLCIDGSQDGILGVCAGVEMLRVLHEEKAETQYPVGVINWTK